MDCPAVLLGKNNNISDLRPTQTSSQSVSVSGPGIFFNLFSLDLPETISFGVFFLCTIIYFVFFMILETDGHLYSIIYYQYFEVYRLLTYPYFEVSIIPVICL